MSDQLPRGYLHDYRTENIADFELPVPLSNRITAWLTPDPPMVMGVDLNRFQAGELLDAKAMYNSGIRFAILEATWGLWQPPTFKEFWPKLVDAGIIVLGYGFFRGDQAGSAQADLLLETIYPAYEAQGFWMPLFSDVEKFAGDTATVPNRLINWRAWIKEIGLEVTPGSYSNIPSWQTLMNNEPLPSDCLGWTAHYTSVTQPLIPVGWTRAQTPFHQYGVATKYSWCPPVPGMASDVDVDRFYGDFNWLMALSKDIEQPLPPPPPPVDLQPILARLDALEATQGDTVRLMSDMQDELDELDARVDILENPLPPPPPVTPPAQTWAQVRVTRDPGANAFHALTNNANGFPIMVAYTPQIQFKLGLVLDVYPDKVDADGSIDFWKLAPAHVPANAPALYVRADNVVKV